MNTDQKKQVLILIQQLRRGGVEVVAVNLAAHLNRDKYDFTFYLQKIDTRQDPELTDLLKKLNARVIVRPEQTRGYIGKYLHLKKVMQETKYDIVHSHVMLYNGLAMRAAYRCGVRKRVSHSHAIKWNREENFIFKGYKKVMQRWINRYATDKLACSQAAGEYLYGKDAFAENGQVLFNGIDMKEFAYNPSVRLEARREFLDHDALLIGHIGTLYRIKNQVFLVEIFAKILEKTENAKLLFIGEDWEKEQVEQKAKSLGVYDRVIFAGPRKDIPRLLQAMDIMIFPSLFEALPVSLIEAQAAQLPCLISDAVTRDVQYNENVDFMSLKEDAGAWAQRAFDLLRYPRAEISVAALKADYDIQKSADKLEKIYEA